MASPTTATRRMKFMTGPPLRYHSSTVFISALSEDCVGCVADVGPFAAGSAGSSRLAGRRIAAAPAPCVLALRHAYSSLLAGGVPDGGRTLSGRTDGAAGRALESRAASESANGIAPSAPRGRMR